MSKKILAVIAGLITAFAIMMAFEFTNSYFFPFPEGMDIMDKEEVQAFTDTLPWMAYIMVLSGWIIGSFVAGIVERKISKSQNIVLAAGMGVLLTVLGIWNNVMLGVPLWFTIVGLFAFIPFTIAGTKVVKN